MSWEPYFPFDTGEDLSIDGPLWYDGTGHVVKNEGDTLELTIDLPAVSMFNVAKMQVSLGIEAVQEGAGNRARAEINGVVTEDDNVTINSGAAAGRRTIDFSVPVQGQHLGLVLHKTGGKKADLKIMGYSFTITPA